MQTNSPSHSPMCCSFSMRSTGSISLTCSAAMSGLCTSAKMAWNAQVLQFTRQEICFVRRSSTRSRRRPPKNHSVNTVNNATPAQASARGGRQTSASGAVVEHGDFQRDPSRHTHSTSRQSARCALIRKKIVHALALVTHSPCGPCGACASLTASSQHRRPSCNPSPRPLSASSTQKYVNR
jgi:hypothetical protein